jgi:hypothetical protein
MPIVKTVKVLCAAEYSKNNETNVFDKIVYSDRDLKVPELVYLPPPPETIPTLSLWWSLCGQMILRAMSAVALLLVGPPMPDRSKVMTQTKRDTRVLPSCGLGCEVNTTTSEGEKKTPHTHTTHC